MHTLRIVVDLVLAALIVYIGVTVYMQYREAGGSTWDRLLSAAKGSATILWGKFCLVVAGVVGNLDSLADLFNAPEAKTFIDNWIGNPKLVAGVMMTVAVVSMMARKRTL